MTIRRRPESLAVSFRPDFDQALLEETTAVEKDCCPFFAFEYSAEERTLTISVSRDDQRPALDGLAYALGGGEDPGA